MRLNEDAVDLFAVHDAGLVPDGFDERAQTQVAGSAQQAFAGTNDQGQGFGREGVMAQAGPVALSPKERENRSPMRVNPVQGFKARSYREILSAQPKLTGHAVIPGIGSKHGPAYAAKRTANHSPRAMSTPGGNCSLDDSVLGFINQLVYARPMYGWGWGEDNGDRKDILPVEVPPPLQLRIAEFFDWNGERRGGLGQIEEPGHVYHGQWLLFYTRHVGRFDFTHNISYYNFHIGQTRPSLYPPAKDPEMGAAWPLPCFTDCTPVWGYGQIAANAEAIARFEKEQAKKWQREKQG